MLVFLKLGGSLITDKTAPQTLRPAALTRLAEEIAEALAARPELRLVLGHGSGSFGHAEAARHGTRQGVDSPAQWRGFAQVSAAAARLNRLVTDGLLGAGIPALALQPSASAVCEAGVIQSLALEPILTALDKGLAPLVYGDVAFDRLRGGTIISTEDIFVWLAKQLRPRRILLAGLEAGVYADWPIGRSVLPRLTPAWMGQHSSVVTHSHAPDVTGGMASKVAEMLALVASLPNAEILIFSGESPGNVRRALLQVDVDFGTTLGAHE